MLQSVLDGTEGSSLIGYFLQSIGNYIDGCSCLVIIVTAHIQTVDAQIPCTHSRDVQVNLVVIGGVSTYMQAEVNSSVHIGEAFYL